MRKIYAQFAEILDYPTPGLLDTVKQASVAVLSANQEAGTLMRQFQQFLELHSPGELEEIYVSAFDFGNSCCLYAGHHLFGEDYRRSLLMVKLKEYYGDFSAGKELPDHICILLKFMARAGDTPESEDIVTECLLPAINTISEQLPKTNPYRPVLHSLLLILKMEEAAFLKKAMKVVPQAAKKATQQNSLKDNSSHVDLEYHPL